MTKPIFLTALFMLFVGVQTVQAECMRPGQQCFKPLYCGIAQACPFGESIAGVCSKDLVCIAEGDACTFAGKTVFSASTIKGVYRKDGNGIFYCAPIF